MKKTLNQMIILALCVTLLFPNFAVIAAEMPTISFTQYAAGQEISNEITGNIEVQISLRLPDNNPEFEVTVTPSSVNNGRPTETKISEDNTVLYYSFKGLPKDKYTLKISGKGYLDYTQEIELGNENIEIRLTNGHDGDNVLSGDSKTPKVGVIGLGDIDKNKKINSDDEKAMIDVIDSGKYNQNYDLNNDGKVNIIDLSYITLNKDKANIKATPLRSLNPDVITIEEPTAATVASGDINNILKNNDEFVTLAPKNSGDISGDNPVEITLDLSKNDQTSGAIVIAPSSNPENNIKAGTVVVECKHGDHIDTREFPINEPTLHTKRTVLLAFNAGIMPVNLVLAKIDKDGSIVIDLEGQIAVKKVTIKVTKTGSNKLADIAKVEFLNSMEDRIPAPELNIPKKLILTPGSEEFTATWDKETNITGYEVSVTCQGKTEIFKTDINSITVTRFNNDDLLNGKEYEVKVQSVNGEWKSGYGETKVVIPQATRKPPAPDNVKVEGGYKNLIVSWKDMKDTDTYTVAYRKADSSSAFKEAVTGLKGTRYIIEGLEDNTKYEVSIAGTNQLGEGTATIGEGRTTNLSPVIMPKYKLINTSNGDGQKPAHIENVIYYSDSARSMVASPLDVTDSTAWGVVDNNFSSYFLVNDWDIGCSYPTSMSSKVEEAPTIVFDKPYKMNYFAIAQVENINGKTTQRITNAKITYWDVSGDTKHRVDAREVITKTDSNGRQYTVIKLAEPITTQKVNIGVSVANNLRRITYAEMCFYEYDELETEINNIFEDQMHIKLKDDVTETTINDLITKLNNARDKDNNEPHPEKEALLNDLEWAKEILNNTAAKDVIEIDTSVTEANDGHITFRGGLNAWQPLGITAYEGEKITIYVGNPNMVLGQNTNLRLIATQYHAEASDWFEDYGTLKIGKNEIPVPNICSLNGVERGGSLYINYTGNNPNEKYAVRVTGGTSIPVLDLTKVEGESARKAAVKDYVEKLKTQVESLKTLHDNNHKDKGVDALVDDYDKKNCIAGATEIVLDQMMYSVAAEPIYNALKLNTSDTGTAAKQLYDSLVAMENMIDLFYEHKGLSKGTAEEVGKTNVYPIARLNIRYHRMFDGAFMYAGGKHIGIEYDSVGGLANGKPIEDENGKYVSGNYFGWGISHEIGHIINESAYTVAEVTNNYFSVLSQAKETNESVRFLYENVYDKVTSGVKGRAPNVFTQLGLYWQLHLAYDKGYNFKMYDTRKEQLDNLIFARMDTYAREIASGAECTAPGASDNTLTYDGANSDNKLMRLACAGAQKNLLEFFERWGMEPDDETREYAKQFPKEERPIYYINDEARLYQLEKKSPMEDGTKVIANIVGGTDKTVSEVKIKLSNTDKIGAMLGYEITRSYMEKDQKIERAVAFVVIDGNSDETITYTDTINSINNRVFTYSVRAVDKYLNVTDTVTLDPVKVSDDGSIDKTNWSVDTNMTSEKDKWDSLDGEEGVGEDTGYNKPAKSEFDCEPAKIKAISKIVDGKADTSYVGSVQGKGEIVISLGSIEQIAALKYDGNALGNVIVEVSADGTNWTKVSESDVEADTILYFNEGQKDGILYFYDTAYVRITIENATVGVTINEIDLLGETGDNVELETIGILEKEFTYNKNSGDFIPKGSLVFYGTYKGNPAYNIVMLWNEKDEIIEGDQIILAPNPGEKNDLGEIHSGKWIYWIEPDQLEKLGIMNNRSIRYQLGELIYEGDLPTIGDTTPSMGDVIFDDYDVIPSIGNQIIDDEEDIFTPEIFDTDDEEYDDDYETVEPDSNETEDEEAKAENNGLQTISNKISTISIASLKTVRAELYRVDHPLDIGAERLVSDTKRIEIPSELPLISFANGGALEGVE